jgi:hypothetical protein
MICGSSVNIASWIAWPWFCDTLEISTPTPSATNRNTTAPSPNTITDPLNGTSNNRTPATTTMVRSIALTRKYGAILPRNTSDGPSGITASCSMVPAWRSRTTPRLVITVPMNRRISAASPGIMTAEVSNSGLKSTVVWADG